MAVRSAPATTARRPWGSAIPTADDLGRTALELIDELGLEALTVRALAARLELSHGNLYRLFTGREQLLDLVAARIIAAARVDAIDAAPADWLHRCAVQLMRAWLAHPRACALMTTRREPLLAVFDAVALRFAQLVPDLRERVLAMHGYMVFLTGWILVNGPEAAAVDEQPALPHEHAHLMRLQRDIAELGEPGEQLVDESFLRGLSAVIPAGTR